MQNLNCEMRLGPKKSVVVCPAAKLPAEVTLDPSAGLESCSRWLEDCSCDQTCAPQIQFSPDSLEDFVALYGGRRCAYCNGVVTAQDWYDNRLSALWSNDEEPNGPKAAPIAYIALADDEPPICSACFSAVH